MVENLDEVIMNKVSLFDKYGKLWSALKKILIVGIVYLFGYMNWSFSWLISPLIFLIIREQRKTDKNIKNNIIKASATTSEKEVILARLKDLPAWVYFPDVERAEWLNQIIKQLWPSVNKYMREYLLNKVQPKLSKKLNKKKLTGFKFVKLILGTIPPRVGGVKVFDKNISRNEIIMDIDLFYVSDCNISFEIRGFPGGIKDFQIQGALRIILKPLMNKMPLVGGFQMFFLNNPTVDFNLTGLVDVLDMPGLGDFFRQVVVELIASKMVLPNKFTKVLSSKIEPSEVVMSEPEGVLRIHVVEAKHLMKKDIGVLGKGKSDPYTVLNIGAEEFRTKTIQNTVNPKWDYWCESIIAESEAQEIFIHLWDKDDGPLDDESLGKATVEVKSIATKGKFDTWITLEQAKHGMVHLRLFWFKLSDSYDDLKQALAETQLLNVPELSTGLLSVYIDSAKNLPMVRTQSKPDPYVVISIGKNVKQTGIIMRNDCPVWEEGVVFLISNPETDSMTIEIFDNKTGEKLGEHIYNLMNLQDKPKLQFDTQPYLLNKSGSDSTISFSLSLRILKADFPLSEEISAINEKHLARTDSTISTGSITTVPPNSKNTTEMIRRQESVRSMPSVFGLVETKEEEEVLESKNVESNEQYLKNLEKSNGSSPSKTASLRHRNVSNIENCGMYGLGKIQLTLRYSTQRQKLIIVVHKIMGLPQKDPSNIPDPYVKLYLLPERNKETKRKTNVIKDNCNPIYDESFEYLISMSDLSTHYLEITVVTLKSIFSGGNNVMGQVIIDLSQSDLSVANTLWFDLQPEIPRD